MFWFDFNWQIQNLLNQWLLPLNLIILALLVVVAWLSIRRPIYAVGLTIILLPTYLFRGAIPLPNFVGATALPITVLELSIIITFTGWLLGKIIRKDFSLNSFGRYQWPIVFILAASTAGLLLAPEPQAAAGLWKAYFIEPILFLLVVGDVIKTSRDRKILLWALGLSTVSVSFLAIYQKITAFGIAEPIWIAPDHRRVTAFFTSPNAVGLFLGPVIALYVGWLLAEIKKLWPTILKVLIIIAATIAVIFTVSQGTWLGLAAAAAFLAFFGWHKLGTTAIVIAMILIAFIIPISRQQLLPLVTFTDAAGQNRLLLWQTATEYLTSDIRQTVSGAGILGFAELHQQTRDPLITEPLLYPHNIFLNFWLEIGLIGLIAFLWLLINFFRQGFWRNRETPNQASNDKPVSIGWLRLGIMAAMVVVIIHGLVDVPYFKNDLAVLFWLIIGLV